MRPWFMIFFTIMISSSALRFHHKTIFPNTIVSMKLITNEINFFMLLDLGKHLSEMPSFRVVMLIVEDLNLED